MTFDAFFQAATNLRLPGEATAPQAGNTPYGYQCRLACGEPGLIAGDTTGRPAAADSFVFFPKFTSTQQRS